MSPFRSVRELLAVTLVSGTITGCNDSAAPQPDLVVFVDAPVEMQAGVASPVRVEIVNPAERSARDPVLHLCIAKFGCLAPPQELEDVAAGERRLLSIPVNAHPDSAGIWPWDTAIYACVDDDADDPSCDEDVLRIRPNLAASCGDGGYDADTVVVIADFACTIGESAMTVARVFLTAGQNYGLFFYDAQGFERPGGGALHAVYDRDGHEIERATVAQRGDGIAPPHSGLYFVVIADVGLATTGFGAATLD